MHQHDINRVRFYSVENMAAGYQLSKGEKILKAEVKSNFSDVNEVLELYNIKKYIDNELYLKSWTQEEIEDFKQKAKNYGQIVGSYFSTINDQNAFKIYKQTLHGYIHSFWEIVCNYSLYKKISKSVFREILENEHHLVHEILTHKVLVTHYDKELRDFLLNYPESAEILLSVYQREVELRRNQKYIPKSLTISDKENIISKYLDSADTNLNYVGLIKNSKNSNDFRVSDKTRLKAKRLHKTESEKLFNNKLGIRYGVNVSFLENVDRVKDVDIDDEHVAHYTYSLDFINKNYHPYQLFKNFRLLFEFIDNQSRINLVSKKSRLGLFEKYMGINSQNEYKIGIEFSVSEMVSTSQIYGYDKIISKLNNSLEDILHFIYTQAFQELYGFAENARFSIPKPTNTFFEKVRLFAPEFESILKQFKLYVEDGEIDFELLQISSSPTTIKNIPSLVSNKYVYFNDDNQEMIGCSNLFFSDQTLLAYVEPFNEDEYHTFFDLLINEKIKFSNYQEPQKPQLNYLIDKKLIGIDNNGFIQVTNPERLFIFKDLYDNEFASFYRYPIEFQKEALQMEQENIVFFESSLFSKPEQSYFNYYLNKSEFTNGLDLRNSYLHGTQANPEEIEKHEHAYFTYLKLVVLTMLKIEDDLQISVAIEKAIVE